jgi:glyoxylate reductase
MDAPDRAALLAGLAPGGKYAGALAVYRHNVSAERVGVFDAELVGALARSVRWVAHNGAGYDQIDVAACAAHGACACMRCVAGAC